MTLALGQFFTSQLKEHGLDAVQFSGWSLAKDKLVSHTSYLQAAYKTAWRANDFFQALKYAFFCVVSKAYDRFYAKHRFPQEEATVSDMKRHVATALQALKKMHSYKPRVDLRDTTFATPKDTKTALQYRKVQKEYKEAIQGLREFKERTQAQPKEKAEALIYALHDQVVSLQDKDVPVFAIKDSVVPVSITHCLLGANLYLGPDLQAPELEGVFTSEKEIQELFERAFPKMQVGSFAQRDDDDISESELPPRVSPSELPPLPDDSDDALSEDRSSIVGGMVERLTSLVQTAKRGLL